MKFFGLLFFVLLSSVLTAQCFEIEKILVDACGQGGDEGKNEMLTFRVGAQDLNAADMNIVWPTANSFDDIVQNASTAPLTTDINNTIVGCGHLIEPTGGILPAGKEILLITSTVFDPTLHSFMNLNDTLIVIYHDATTGSGNFSNHDGSNQQKTLSISFSTPMGCADQVTYNRSLLVEQDRVTQGGENGAFVSFTPNGIATYDNLGCQGLGGTLSIEIESNLMEVCGGETLNLTATVNGSTNPIIWQSANGTFGTPNGNTNTFAVDNNITTPFYIYGGVESTCNDTIYDSLLINIPVSNLNFSVLGDSICFGKDSILLIANNADTYSWTNNQNNIIIQNDSLYISQPGTYQLVGSSNCFTDTLTFTFENFDNQAPIGVIADLFLCDNDEVVELAASTCLNCTYNWINGSTSDTTSLAPINYNGSVTVSKTNECGSASDVFSYGLKEINALFDVLDSVGCATFTPTFFNQTFGDTLNATYNWDFGNGTTSNEPNTSYELANTYTVMLTASNGFCTSSFSRDLEVENCILFTEAKIPNVFSPNNDNINDNFFIETINGKNLEGTIYNRWGRKVKELNGLDATWDGGKSSAGTYYYIISVTFLDDTVKEYKGHLQLVK